MDWEFFEYSLAQIIPDGGGTPNKVSSLLSKSSFVHQLNAKLAQQQHQVGHHQHGTSESQHQQRVRHEPADHHESLMDQIRRGTSLRRARSTSDRSGPHFKHWRQIPRHLSIQTNKQKNLMLFSFFVYFFQIFFHADVHSQGFNQVPLAPSSAVTPFIYTKWNDYQRIVDLFVLSSR